VSGIVKVLVGSAPMTGLKFVVRTVVLIIGLAALVPDTMPGARWS